VGQAFQPALPVGQAFQPALPVGQAFQPASSQSQDVKTRAAKPALAIQTQAGKPAPQGPPVPLEKSEAQHVLLRTITQGLKGYTAREANRLLGRRGAFWQDEGFDHWIRDESRYENCILYMDRNPVEAGLCDLPEEYSWSSAGESAATTG